MDSFIQTFHLDWKILIAQAINFTIVFVILYIFALKPLKKLMVERSERIAKGVNDAKNNAELLAKTQKEYDDVLTKAKIEAHKLFQEGKKEAEQNKIKMMELAQQDVENLISNGKKVLDREKLKIIDDAKKEIVSLVVKATEKLLQSSPNESFAEETLEQMNKT